MAKLTVTDLEIQGKTVLMRADFNVPLDENRSITDDTRIRETVPTIDLILKKNPKKLILMSHLGRPDGKKVEKYSLKPVANRLKELLNQPVKFLDESAGETVKQAVVSASEKVILLENLRFHAEEEANDKNFSEQLGQLADVFVNDAFGTAHRAHASTEGVTHFLTSGAGLLLEKEIRYLGNAVENPGHPFVVILGGAKVSDKIKVIENLLPKCDAIVIGGGMAYTFLKAKGIEIGTSKLEADKVDFAAGLLKKAEAMKKEIVLPVDHVVAAKFGDAGSAKTTSNEAIPANMMGLDIGPKTVELFKQKVRSAKTIVWNGPLGVFEQDAFASGTKELCSFISGLKGCVSVIGGGDTAAAVAKFGCQKGMTHISTGGGASLEFLEGKTLPGIAALTEKK